MPFARQTRLRTPLLASHELRLLARGRCWRRKRCGRPCWPACWGRGLFRAIALLGAPDAAAFGALAPVVPALGGWIWRGDALRWTHAAAVAATVTGVVLAGGAVAPRAAGSGRETRTA